MKRLSPECRSWVFSVLIGKVPSGCHLSPHGCALGALFLFPFVCSPSGSKHHMEMTHVALATDLGHDHTSLSLFRDLQKASSCECQQVPTYKANSRCCNDGQMSKHTRQH